MSIYFDVTTIQLSLIVTATGQETCASLSIIISCHLSRLIGLKISYLVGYYTTSMAFGYSIAYALINELPT